MGALCAVRPTIFSWPLRARICGAVSRGDLGWDTPTLIPSMNRAGSAMHALPAQMKSTHVE
jgi:hypothetical protein